MKAIRYVLIAEDDEEAIASWQRDIREFNQDGNQKVEFMAIFAKSRRSAINVLDRTRINCAIVDLRLPNEDIQSGGITEPVGNDVLEQLLTEVGVPAVVYSGYIEQASETVTSSAIQVIRKKGGGAMEALEWLAGHEDLMSAMEATRTRIARESARLFSKSIWPRWKKSWNASTDAGTLADVITRQMASHVAETLGLPETQYHPDEFYYVPPLDSERLSTGDLTVVSGQVYVVMTPRCNMARDYPNHIQLALCKSMSGAWSSIREKFISGEAKKGESAARELRQYATQGHATATHFLPPCGEEGPWLVDFKEIMTVPASEIPALIEARLASIASSFVPNLVQRYAAYLGRIGQPDLDCAELRQQMCK